MKPPILISGHLGLGDTIICNAIYRRYALDHELVCIPVKYGNVPSVQFMLRDVENIVIRPIEDDEDLLLFHQQTWKYEKLGLGCFGANFTYKDWDRQFFDGAGMDFQTRWSEWKCLRDPIKEEKASNTWYSTDAAFVHDDHSRGMEIMISNTPHQRPIRSETIFDYWAVIEQAPEIHCISSSFALFIDSIPDVPEQKLYLHKYARGDEELPHFKKNWKILK